MARPRWWSDRAPPVCGSGSVPLSRPDRSGAEAPQCTLRLSLHTAARAPPRWRRAPAPPPRPAPRRAASADDGPSLRPVRRLAAPRVALPLHQARRRRMMGSRLPACCLRPRPSARPAGSLARPVRVAAGETARRLTSRAGRFGPRAAKGAFYLPKRPSEPLMPTPQDAEDASHPWKKEGVCRVRDGRADGEPHRRRGDVYKGSSDGGEAPEATWLPGRGYRLRGDTVWEERRASGKVTPREQGGFTLGEGRVRGAIDRVGRGMWVPREVNGGKSQPCKEV